MELLGEWPSPRPLRRAVVRCGTRPTASEAEIVATPTPDRSTRSGRDMPAVRRTHSSAVSDVLGSEDAAMDKAWQPPLLRIGGHLVDGAGGQLRDSASRPNKRV